MLLLLIFVIGLTKYFIGGAPLFFPSFEFHTVKFTLSNSKDDQNGNQWPQTLNHGFLLYLGVEHAAHLEPAFSAIRCSRLILIKAPLNHTRIRYDSGTEIIYQKEASNEILHQAAQILLRYRSSRKDYVPLHPQPGRKDRPA